MNDKSPFDFIVKKIKEYVSADQFDEFTETLNKEKKVPPNVIVIGQSSVGKSSTINSLFNLNEKVSHIGAGTLTAKENFVTLSNGIPLQVFDMPGLGEDIKQDQKYEEIYRQVLPKADVILYIVQADRKGLSRDQKILKEIVVPIIRDLKERLVVGLNKVDQIGPGNWNEKFNWPSSEQEESINRVCQSIRKQLSFEVNINQEQIEYYSATKRYRLLNLLNSIVKSSGKVGWKFPINPSDPIELADPSVQSLLRKQLEK